MGFKLGNTKGGGRPKGSKNKETVLLSDKATQLGIDPFEVLLLFAAGDWKKLKYKSETIVKEYNGNVQWEYTISPQTRAKAAAEACDYLYPRRKAVDLGITPGEDGAGFKIVVEDYTVKEKKSDF